MEVAVAGKMHTRQMGIEHRRQGRIKSRAHREEFLISLQAPTPPVPAALLVAPSVPALSVPSAEILSRSFSCSFFFVDCCNFAGYPQRWESGFMAACWLIKILWTCREAEARFWRSVKSRCWTRPVKNG